MRLTDPAKIERESMLKCVQVFATLSGHSGAIRLGFPVDLDGLMDLDGSDWDFFWPGRF